MSMRSMRNVGRLLVPRVEALAEEELARTRRRRQPVRTALGSADVEDEAAVPLGDEVVAEEVGLGRVAERLVQVRVVGAVVHVLLRARALHGEVDEAGGAPVAGDLVGGRAVDPRLQVDEVGVVAAELAVRPAERVDGRVAGVLRLERQVEGLAEVLGEVAEAVGALQRVRRRWCP